MENSKNKELNERKKLILKAIIEAHVKGGGPVGSKYLTQNKQIALSSATIRNEMAELEEMGYLEQPHTSAGRIPSEYGYRFYVNNLIQRYKMTSAELRRLNSLMKSKLTELDFVLDRATKTAAALTNYTSLSVKPKQRTVYASHFKTVYISPNFFILVMLMSNGMVKTRQLRTEFPVSEDLLERLEALLNANISGVDPDNVTVPMIIEMESKMPECETLINPIIKCVYEVINEIDSGDLRYEGVNLLLQYPEYSDIERFKSMLGMLERKDELLNLISSSEHDGLQVYIGSENSVDIMKSSSLIFKTVKRGGKIVGAIGVIGPCRMDYSKVITTIDCLARTISDEETDALTSGDGGSETENEETTK